MDIDVSTIAGCGVNGYENGKTENSKFFYPEGICISQDHTIYVADSENNCIRMISNDIVSTVAGSTERGFRDGNAENAMFNWPIGICLSNKGKIYVTDYYNNRIRMISEGIVSTIAGCDKQGFQDGFAQQAMFNCPQGICTSRDGKLYVSDTFNNRIRMISDGIVSTIAGCGEQGFQDGFAENAMFYGPEGICISDEGKIYVVDRNNNRIRMISDGLVSTIAGCGKQGFEDGKAENAMFKWVHGICLSNEGDIYVTDSINNCVRMISDGVVSTIAGSEKRGFEDGKAQNAMFYWPRGLCTLNDGNLYVADSGNNYIRMISGLPYSLSFPAFEYFELTSLIESKLLSDITLSIGNHQYELHTSILNYICPMILVHRSVIEKANVSILNLFFEMIYSNSTKSIIKRQNEHHPAHLMELIELIWLFESFEIKDQFFVSTCVAQFQIEFQHLLTRHEQYKSVMDVLKFELIDRIHDLIAWSESEGIQTTRLTKIDNFVENQIKKQLDNERSPTTTSIENITRETNHMRDVFILLGLSTIPKVVNQREIEVDLKRNVDFKPTNVELTTQPDFSIMINDGSFKIECHKLILQGKWPYFRRMMKSRLAECLSNQMTLPEDWNASRLLSFVKYLYTSEVSFNSPEDAIWLLENAGLYEFIEICPPNSIMIPKPDFQLLIETCTKLARGKIDSGHH